MKQGFAEEITFKAENAVLNGTGAGQPLGIFNSGALVTESAESGQAADTITATNILNMFSRLPTRSATNAVWLVTQECLPQLWTMTMPTSNVIMFQPPGLNGNIEANAPYGTLLGRPVLPVEYLGRLGDLGDILLADLSQYLMIDKGGVDAQESMHVRFLYEEMTFRITYRVDGQPAWRTAMTPASGGPTQSPFVTLAAR
jgi:HK97 family phage major capsid protein